MTHPDTAQAQVIWGYRQPDADAALAHLEAAAASLVAAREILWRFSEWPRIATEAGKLHTQVYSLIGKDAAKRRKPGKRPAVSPPRGRDAAATSRTGFPRFHPGAVALDRQGFAPVLGHVR